jgi:hypothetical protein
LVGNSAADCCHAFVGSGFGCSLLELFGKHPNRDPNGFEPVRHNAFSLFT